MDGSPADSHILNSPFFMVLHGVWSAGVYQGENICVKQSCQSKGVSHLANTGLF